LPDLSDVVVDFIESIGFGFEILTLLILGEYCNGTG
jgi:hypothetical protein